MTDLAPLRALLDFCQQLEQRGITSGLQPPDLPDQLGELDLRPLKALLAHMLDSYQLAAALAQGNLGDTSGGRNPLAMPLKAMQSNLRHLTWQTEQVSKGDFRQQVHFLGDFSSAFNSMLEALQQKRQLEEQLIASEAKLRALTAALGEGVYVVTPEGQLDFMNPEAERLLGFRFSDISGTEAHKVFHGQGRDGTKLSLESCELCSAIRRGVEYHNGDDALSCADGRIIPAAVVAKPIQENGQYTGMVIAFHDISHQKQYQQSLVYINEILEKQATTDPLTEINNRMSFNRQLQLETDKVNRYGQALALILFDVDHFKKINDHHGHLVGDQVLKELARTVKQQIREVDFFARWGGEEFVILLQANLSHAHEIAEKLRLLLAEQPFCIGRQVTSSFGVTVYCSGESPEQFTNRADQALYRAKHNGRNCTQSLPAPDGTTPD